MRKRILTFGLTLTVCATVLAVAGSAGAAPIQLHTGEITKMKFTNFENLIDNDKDGKISVGDDFVGIMKLTTISDLADVKDLNAQLLTKEVTGFFKISVVGVTPGPLVPLAPGHVDFALNTGDFINLYVGQGATKNWNPADTADSNSNGIPDCIDWATDGSLWMSVLPGTFYEGVSDTDVSGVSVRNRNWVDLTVNNTEYYIVQQLWSSIISVTPNHTFLGASHTDHLADVYFESKLTSGLTSIPNWGFKSEDPVYIFVTPEPGSIVLLLAGFAGLGLAVRRKMRAA